MVTPKKGTKKGAKRNQNGCPSKPLAMTEREKDLMHCLVPENMWGAIDKWIDNGIPPGSFLMAVIENDLLGAFGSADRNNFKIISNYIAFFYNYAPKDCWGSKQKAMDWHIYYTKEVSDENQS